MIEFKERGGRRGFLYPFNWHFAAICKGVIVGECSEKGKGREKIFIITHVIGGTRVQNLRPNIRALSNTSHGITSRLLRCLEFQENLIISSR